MKKILFTFFVLFALVVNAQQEKPVYDSILAKKYGADEYGMKHYTMVILKTGTATITDETKLNEIFRGHLDNIYKMFEQGKLVIAGPLGKNDKTYRGIYLFNTTDMKEVEALIASDPAVKAKVLEAEIFDWYAAAGLPAFHETQQKIEKIKH